MGLTLLCFLKNNRVAQSDKSFPVSQIDWSESEVRLYVPNTMADSMCGLCGDFDGKPSNDYVPSTSTLPTSSDSFINRYSAPS